MLNKILRSAGVAVVLLCASAAPAVAQTNARLGWLNELGGSCWQGRNASGAVVDRQCFQVQFGRFLRASITRGANYRGDTVLGWSRERARLEMYAWTNQGEPTIVTPHLESGQLVFDGANGSNERAVWRRTDNGFEVAGQRRSGNTWGDAQVVTYTRDGAAPAAYSAGAGPAVQGRSFGWLNGLAGRCYRQTEPRRAQGTRGCFAFQHPPVLRQTWYRGGTTTGEAALFRGRGGEIQFFRWDEAGNFGAGYSQFAGQRLVSTSDDNTRNVMRRRQGGLEIMTEGHSGAANAEWQFVSLHRFERE